MVRIAPSILSADFAALSESIARVGDQADLLHVDVMDGHFVPNITIGPPVVSSLRKRTELHLDCHLMISEPAKYLEAFREAGANGCSVHVEVSDTDNLLRQMSDLGLEKGLAVNPDTPFEEFEGFLEQLDLILVMTVYPGFGGQSFMDDVIPKIEQTAESIRRLGLTTALEVDGGINVATARKVVDAGATVLVAGNAIFNTPDPREAARVLRDSVGP